jgi:hypothetical protein
LLRQRGRELDPLGEEAWMPRETKYKVIDQGDYVTRSLADVDAVLLSKALKAAHKNRHIITEFLARGGSARFFSLAKKFALDLEQFV